MLSDREDLLVEVSRAVATPEACYLGEVERLGHVLEAERPERAWLEKVAPALLVAFEGESGSAFEQTGVAGDGAGDGEDLVVGGGVAG